MDSQKIHHFVWFGRDAPHLDKPAINRCNSMVIGCYGGNKGSGADKNEDTAWCLAGDDWQMGMLCDAHNSAESSTFITELFNRYQQKFTEIMIQPIDHAFPKLQHFILQLFTEQTYQNIRGETAVLVCAQKGGFLSWFCIGDNVVYLLHPELKQLGQTALNQRNFYEWVGAANTFDLPVPCYSSGIREIRQGKNLVIMTTDGLLECGSRPFENPQYFFDHFTQSINLEHAVQYALDIVHVEQGKDSATIIAWSVENNRKVSYPTQ